MGWVDVHAHLDMLEEGPEAALAKMSLYGVEQVFTIGTELADLPVVLSLAERFAPRVFCTLGIHPHHGNSWTAEVENFLRLNVNHPRCVAIGEIGLDYYYKNSEPAEQKESFRAQLALASELGMPVEIHTRDAEKDTIEILEEFSGKVKGLIHCFTGTAWLAERALNLGYNISFSGVLTFKNATELRSVCQNVVPLDRLHVETDAPFLAPIPERGKKNTPGFVVHTAKVVADLKGVSLEDLQQITNENTRQLFPKMNL
jgi:TatD DNase family protein